jgi:aminopeptidase N
MRKTTLLVLSILIMIAVSTPLYGIAQAVQKPCTQDENLQAEKAVDNLRTWDEIYRYFRLYGRCDDVDAGEGSSDAVAHILARHWETLHQVSQLAAKDKGFRKFVIYSVSPVDSMKDVQKIREFAIHSCPAGLHQLCKDLRVEADEAIEEDASVHKNP